MPGTGHRAGLGSPRSVFDSWMHPLVTTCQGLRLQRCGELQAPEGGWDPGPRGCISRIPLNLLIIFLPWKAG